MHEVLRPRSRSLPSLALLAMASGCPANPPDVTLRPDGGSSGSRSDASSPDAMPDASPYIDAGPMPDASPYTDSGSMEKIVEYGWPPSSEFPRGIDYDPDMIIMQPFTVSYPGGEVAYLGMIVKGLAGTRARLGIYSGDGEPETLVATTDVFVTFSGINQYPPLSPVDLPAGDYWSAVIFDDTTSLATSNTTVSSLRVAENVPFESALPENLAASLTVDAPDINVYIGVREP